MNPKLLRKELYDDDYVLNEQEYKEFYLSLTDPYWKIRGMAYSLSLNCFGDKQSLIKRCQNLLFNNYLHKKPQNSYLKEVAEADIEIFVSTLKCSTGKFDNFPLADLQYQNSDEEVVDERVHKEQFPWGVVPELSKMDKRLTYQDIQRGMTSLMRNTMCFYNHFLDQEDHCLTGVVGLPYTPQMLNYFSPQQMYAMVKNFGMRTNYEHINNVVDIFKQKLMDLYYAVDDNPKLHGIIPCQSYSRQCTNLASQHCKNHMCKICCQDLQNRMPCTIHDKMEQFFRFKLKTLYTFEEKMQFDRSKTLRIYSRRLIRKYDIEQVFDRVPIQWDKLVIYHHYASGKIEYVYLVFQTPEVAQKVYKERHIHELKLEKYDVQIQSLNEGFWSMAEKFKNPENVVVIVRPQSSIELVEDIPRGTEYTRRLHQLITTVTNLQTGDYNLEFDINPITQEKDQIHTYVTVQNKEQVDQIYNCQPYFGCLVVHKLSHIQYFPFLRINNNTCLMCPTKKEETCLHDMCLECCSRQKYDIIHCPCSDSAVQNMTNARENKISSDMNIQEIICEKCCFEKDSDCTNGLCGQCCLSQSIKNECQLHESSDYVKELLDLTPHMMARRMLQVVGEMNMKFRAELQQGHYDWFRPIHNCYISNLMIKTNKDLQETKDNGSVVRGQTNLKIKRQGKIFTFQANQPITIWQNVNEKSYENVNKKGNAFVEYVYGNENCRLENQIWEKSSINKYRMCSEAEYEKLIKSLCLQNKLQNTFDLFLMGLDVKTYSIKELQQDVYSRLVTQVGYVQPHNTMLLDNETILAEIDQHPLKNSVSNLEDNLYSMGRIFCVKFDNLLDAIALFSGELKINLPLVSCSNGEPIIYPSQNFLKLISEIDYKMLDFKNAGNGYSMLNKKIDELNNTLSNMMRGGNLGGGLRQGGGPQKGGGGKGGNKGGNKGGGNNFNKGGFNKNNKRQHFNGNGPDPQKKIKF